MISATSPATEKSWFGHPRGLTILFLTEMWEMFSFFGMRAILVYYMTKHLDMDQEYASVVYGVYAAVAQDPFCASLARSHSNTNVLCIGGKIIGSALAVEVVKAWMSTEWLTDEKYRRRVQKVVDINDRHLKPV